MPVEIKVPALPESVADATMLEWHKQAGDTISRDDNLVDIETDKVVLEVPAPIDGVLVEIRKHSGETVVADEVIAVIEESGSDVDAAAGAAERRPEEPAAEVPAAAASAPTAAAAGEETPLSPAVRRLVDEYGIEASQVAGTGPQGRILKEDVLRYVERQATPELAAPAAEAPPPPAATEQPSPPAATEPEPADQVATARREPSTPVTPVSAAEPVTERRQRRQPMSRLRRTIAQRLVEAQQTAALLTTFNEVDLHAVLALRKRYRDAFEERHGTRLGFMSFFVKASVEALRRFPVVNAKVEGDDIVYNDYYDIGIAVASPRGLVVPVVRDADTKGFADIEKEIGTLGDKAREGNLSVEELTGGSFTITNGGVFGSLLSTPIVNPPQSAILGMHKIQERPVAEDGQVVVRPMMYLALSYDHRIIDGREAVQFLVAVKDALEDPTRLLLQV